MKIKDLMSKNVVAAESGRSVCDVARLMRENDVGAIPVFERDVLAGIVTDRDIVLRCVAAGKDPAECTAGEIMSGGAVSVTPNQSVADAARIMAAVKIRRLPVIDDGRLAGMVSFGDIARSRADDTEISEAISEISSPFR
ncbi:MAG: CBS domain-containing protein [Clostridia bacterium]|nr:CBS domain-containing protein [Clostridia bacterium]